MKKYKILLTILVATVFSASFTILTPAAHAAYNSNNLIDDFTFNRTTAISAAGIDALLNSKNSCISPNSGFSAPDPIGYNVSQGYLYGGNVSAGTVIAHAAQAYDLNPQVLVTTLQKEQSLVTSTSCTTNVIAKAVGYACPDGGSSYSYSGLNLYTRNGTTYTSVNGICVNSAPKAGFTQQLIRAAWLLKFSQQRSLGNVNWAIIRGNWNNSDDLSSCYSGAMTQGYRKRCTSDSSATYYDGYTTIDGVSTLMGSGATASLYRYTPHFHGNQNFVSIFNQYFGSQYANDTFTPHPDGTLVSDGQRIYIIKGGERLPIGSGSVFDSYGYIWSSVKAASTGDLELPVGATVSELAPGTLAVGPDGVVYVISTSNGTTQKQWISASTFDALKYKWSRIMHVAASQLPSTTVTGFYANGLHPSGSLIVSNGSVYLIDGSTKRYIPAWAFISNNYQWDAIVPRLKPMHPCRMDLMLIYGKELCSTQTVAYT